MVVKPLNSLVVKKKKIFFKFQFFFFIKSFIIQKLVNILCKGGKKIKSEKIIISYFQYLKKNFIYDSPVSNFFLMLDVIKPPLDLVLRRVGKKVHQVPVPLRSHNQYLKCLRMIKKYINTPRCKQNVVNSLLAEHLNVISDKNNSILLKKKQILFQTAIENRMFTHYRWY